MFFLESTREIVFWCACVCVCRKDGVLNLRAATTGLTASANGCSPRPTRRAAAAAEPFVRWCPSAPTVSCSARRRRLPWPACTCRPRSLRQESRLNTQYDNKISFYIHMIKMTFPDIQNTKILNKKFRQRIFKLNYQK